MAGDDSHDLNATSESRSSILGIVSIAIALSVMVLLGVAYALAMNPNGSMLYAILGDGAYTALGYVCAAACILGAAFGVEGCRHPTSHKVPAIVGAMLNVTLLMLLAFGPFAARMLMGPIE